MKEKLKSLTAVFYTPILIYFIFFVIISLVAIASATPLARVQYTGNFVLRQIIFFGAGIVVAFFVMLFELKRLRYLRWILYGLCFILLLVIFIVGETYPSCVSMGLIPCINGATRWINLPGFQIQPSEFMRIALILVVADVIQKHNEKFLHESRTFKSDLWLIIKAFLVILAPTALIYTQPDTGITILVFITTIIMLITAGIKWTYILGAGAIAAVITVTFLSLIINEPEVLFNVRLFDRQIFFPHQFNRIYGWIDPFQSISGIGRQLSYGLMAMASGGIFGNGFQSFTLFFPEPHTDFIFAVIGMDFGMIGSMVVIGVSLLFNFSILNIAILNRDHYNGHVCVGIFASLMTQQFWNIGMTLGILPITGVTLPFISHGGSSVLASMVMLGLVLSSHVEGLTIKRNTTVYREGVSYLEEKELTV